ncbi:protein of unknown function [Azospirillum baldaniorum]|uniref:Uncharacterized protein n=1 Tax=Azospirillum baldaniorum TaxID=1064539 RepID=A0A9P1JNR0_9PROT|nr:protein of unknown function [Azospirillum baldaniorum]
MRRSPHERSREVFCRSRVPTWL